MEKNWLKGENNIIMYVIALEVAVAEAAEAAEAAAIIHRYKEERGE